MWVVGLTKLSQILKHKVRFTSIYKTPTGWTAAMCWETSDITVKQRVHTLTWTNIIRRRWKIIHPSCFRLMSVLYLLLCLQFCCTTKPFDTSCINCKYKLYILVTAAKFILNVACRPVHKLDYISAHVHVDSVCITWTWSISMSWVLAGMIMTTFPSTNNPSVCRHVLIYTNGRSIRCLITHVSARVWEICKSRPEG